MGTYSNESLPTIDGRRPRIAFVVYNDTYADTRVLKIAATAAEAGADVRIFAFSSRTGHFGPGLETGPVEIDRVPLREIAHLLTRWGLSARRLLGRPVPTYTPTGAHPEQETTATVTPAAPTPTPTPTPAPRPAAGKRAKGLAIDLWRRADATIKQGSFWMRASSHMTSWRPDVIHAHDANTLIAALAVGRRLSVPYVYDSHELWTERNISANEANARIDGVIASFQDLATGLQDQLDQTAELTTPGAPAPSVVPPAPMPSPSPSARYRRDIVALPRS